MEKVYYQNKLQAIIIRKKNYKNKKGIHFFTKKNLAMQAAYMSHPKNHIIKPHIHRKVIRKIFNTSEVLIVLKGLILVNFFNKKKKIFKTKKISNGDIILFITGGHGFKILRKSNFFEVKQGPYKDKQLDKTYFYESK